MQRPSPSATIVFDLDGTLVDTAPDLIAALNEALTLERVDPVSAEVARGMIGAGARALLARGLEEQCRIVSDARFDELHRAFLSHYEGHIADESRVFPGVESALDGLFAAGHRLAVCTNKTERFAVMLLDELGLRHRFPVIVGGDTMHRQKPDPLPLQAAIQRAGGDGAPAILVGDSATDLWTARNAGIPIVGVSFGYSDIAMAELRPDRLIHHYDDLNGAIEHLLSTGAQG